MNQVKLSEFAMPDSDRIYMTVNDIFDLRIVRTDDGVVVDIFPKIDITANSIASCYALDPETRTR